MKIVVLDKKTFGDDVSLDIFKQYGEVIFYEVTKENETLSRVQGADIVITNKVVISKEIIDNSNLN